MIGVGTSEGNGSGENAEGQFINDSLCLLLEILNHLATQEFIFHEDPFHHQANQQSHGFHNTLGKASLPLSLTNLISTPC